MRSILILLLFAFTLNLSAQRYATTKKKAIEKFEQAQKDYYKTYYKEAIEKLDLAIKKDDGFIEAYLLKAQIYFEVGDQKKEIAQYVLALEKNRAYTPKIQFLLSAAYFTDGQYKASLEMGQEAQEMDIKSARLERMIEEGITAAAFALELYEHPVPYEPLNLGPNVNSPYDDYWPMLSTDGKKIYTTKTLPIIKDMPISRKNSNEDFFINFMEKDSTWGQAFEIRPLNTRTNEGAPSISADGQTFVFTACNRRNGLGKCDLYISKRRHKGWTEPKNMGAPINTWAMERQPSLSPDGKTLYFASTRKGTDGLEDIWVSHLVNKKWTEPTNLGKSINSDGMEWAPFIHPDGKTLYFASNGHPGMGGLDIFKSTRINDTTWTQAQNLGYPINTKSDEQSLFVSISGDLALISSNRANDNRGLEIYSFPLYEEAQPNYVSYLEGFITDAKSKAPLKAIIDLVDLKTGEIIIQPESEAETGAYLLCLPSERDYMLNISKEGYMPYSGHFALDNNNRFEPLKKDIQLQPIELNAHVVLKNIFFELDSYELKEKSKVELEKLISFLNKNSSISIEISGHTDNQGSRDYNRTLSKNRANTVYKYLIAHDILASRLSYKGFGFDQPIYTNDTPEGRAKNRRTEFKIVGL